MLRDLQAHELAIHDRTRRPEDVGLPYIEALKQDIRGGNGHLLVAEEGGAILGYASLILSVSMENERDEVPYTHAYVGDLAVLADQRGGGIGSALLAACEDLSRNAGQRWIRLGVLAANGRARAFYAREGYGEHLVTLEKPL